MLRISFPSMGWSKIAFKGLMNRISGIEIITPPKVNSKIAELGIKHAPEFVCFPFKVVLGEFINLIENYDVHHIVMSVGCGPCRMGYYSPVLERILKDLGYDVEIIPLQQADLTTLEYIDSFYAMCKITGEKVSRIEIILHSLKYLYKSKHVERILYLGGLIRCREIHKGDTTKTVEKLMNNLDKTNSIRLLNNFDRVIRQEYSKIPIKRGDFKPLRIMVSGEIHVFLEPYVNMDILKKFGEAGVEVHRAYHVFDWTIHKLNLNIRREKLERIAKDYVFMDIGGEAIWDCGQYISCHHLGFDGYVLLYPLLCMPEVTLRGIIEGQTPRTFYVPIQYYSVDEHTAYEGLRTRMETFISLMESNREHNPRFKDRYIEPILISEIFDKPSIMKRVKKINTNIVKTLNYIANFVKFKIFNNNNGISYFKRLMEFLVYGERKPLLKQIKRE